eukprot:2222899-Rhodomonas_salina.1
MRAGLLAGEFITAISAGTKAYYGRRVLGSMCYPVVSCVGPRPTDRSCRMLLLLHSTLCVGADRVVRVGRYSSYCIADHGARLFAWGASPLANRRYS